MSRLTIFADHHADTPASVDADWQSIQRSLAERGVKFERVTALVDLPAGASNEDVLAAYKPFIDAEKAATGFVTADVVRIVKGTPNTAPMRAKFLSEHVHTEDEARLFAEGSGAFYLHLGVEVLVIVCERGDYLRVPAGTKHWFDMGPDPDFTAVRLFTNPEGWVAQFTGDTIADRFPRYE
ncbi:MAG: acireductone dioxygenase [Polyangiaceae bacterium]